MTEIRKHIFPDTGKEYVVLDAGEFYVCSFTEFFPFCHKRYFISNYKDFNTFTQAGLNGFWVLSSNIHGDTSVMIPIREDKLGNYRPYSVIILVREVNADTHVPVEGGFYGI